MQNSAVGLALDRPTLRLPARRAVRPFAAAVAEVLVVVTRQPQRLWPAVKAESQASMLLVVAAQSELTAQARPLAAPVRPVTRLLVASAEVVAEQRSQLRLLVVTAATAAKAAVAVAVAVLGATLVLVATAGLVAPDTASFTAGNPWPAKAHLTTN